MRSKWIFSEAKLAEATGISRVALVAFRKKELGTGDYRKAKKGKGRAIQLSQQGVEKVLEWFGIKDADLDGAKLTRSGESQSALNQSDSAPTVNPSANCVQPEKSDASAIIPEPVSPVAEPELKLVKVSKFVSNTRIVQALGNPGEYFNVIVPHSGVWALGDFLKIKESQMHKGFWELVGKSPRWRGDRLYQHEFMEANAR